MKKLMKIIKKPELLLLFFMNNGYIKMLSDELYLKVKYRLIFKNKLDLKNPKSFNEKMNYLKIYDRKEIYTNLADKIKVKEIVSKKIGKEYVIKLIRTYSTADDIDLDNLPNRFVIKCNHDSGGAFICKDKKSFDLKKIKKQINKNLKRNWYWANREWPYKNIIPRVLIEEYIEDPDSEDLIDYKFLCFNGKPKYVYTTVKNNNIYENYYDINFNMIEINHGFPRRKKEFEKPINYELMVELVTILCKEIPFVRIDMHNINGKIYFGEYTFYDWAGMKPYKKEIIDDELGAQLLLK